MRKKTKRSKIHAWYLIVLILIAAVSFFYILNNSQAGISTVSVSINNTPPDVFSVYIADDQFEQNNTWEDKVIDLTAGNITDIHINGRVKDVNGSDDMTTVSAVFYLDDGKRTANCTPDVNDCYRIDSCVLSNPNQVYLDYDCVFQIAYNAHSTQTGGYGEDAIWRAQITVDDEVTTTIDSSYTTHIGLLAMVDHDSVIDFGKLKNNQSTTLDDNYTMPIRQRGNDELYIKLRIDNQDGNSALECDQFGSIESDRIKFSKYSQPWSGRNKNYTLKDYNKLIDLNLGYQTEDNDAVDYVHWNISIPEDVKGICSETIIITAIPIEAANTCTLTQCNYLLD